jgi:hypothetical protein
MAVTWADVQATADADSAYHARIDWLREAMLGEMQAVEGRHRQYLRWYSPPYNERTMTHDAWTTPIKAEHIGLTRANFPISRAVVDIWSSLEAAKPAILRAEPEPMMPPVPDLDENKQLRMTLLYGQLKKVEQIKASMRAQTLRKWMRRDGFPLKNWVSTRRKDLYGYSWVKVWPDVEERRPKSYVVKRPTTVFPEWSNRDPEEVEQILHVYLVSARKVAQMYPGLFPIRTDGVLDLNASAEYRDLDDRYYDATRTMVWVEECWWIDREYDNRQRVTASRVHMVKRILHKIVNHQVHDKWKSVPFVYYENIDERDSWGFSDIAPVIDINDEFNRRLSQQGDIIGMYSAPRFQLLGSYTNRKIDMPGPFELIALSDQERIEQILARIDTFPAQNHFAAITDLLHRVTGLPPIVWGLIANAQTSGRALTASWKATEARLAPKLLRNEMSLNRWRDIVINYAEVYDWQGGSRMFLDRFGEPYRDFRWDFPPMEPRDFQEVTVNEITKRDAGGQSTLGMMRAWGDEQAEDTLEEYLAEALNPLLHADKVTAFYLSQRAQLDNIAYAQQLGQQVQGAVNPASVSEAVGNAREAQQAQPTPVMPPGTPMPPTQPGQAGNAGESMPGTAENGAQPNPLGPGANLSSGQLLRNGKMSNQMLLTRRF